MNYRISNQAYAIYFIRLTTVTVVIIIIIINIILITIKCNLVLKPRTMKVKIFTVVSRVFKQNFVNLA